LIAEGVNSFCKVIGFGTPDYDNPRVTLLVLHPSVMQSAKMPPIMGKQHIVVCGSILKLSFVGRTLITDTESMD